MWEGYCLKGLRADKPDIEWHEVHEKPFSIHGLLCKDALTRMSDEDSSKVSPAVHAGSASPAGGRIRFATDSPYIAIKPTFRRMTTAVRMSQGLLTPALIFTFLTASGSSTAAPFIRP